MRDELDGPPLYARRVPSREMKRPEPTRGSDAGSIAVHRVTGRNSAGGVRLNPQMVTPAASKRPAAVATHQWRLGRTLADWLFPVHSSSLRTSRAACQRSS